MSSCIIFFRAQPCAPCVFKTRVAYNGNRLILKQLGAAAISRLLHLAVCLPKTFNVDRSLGSRFSSSFG